MSWRVDVWNRLHALLFADRRDRESREEMRFHLDMETEKHVRAGMSPRAARRKAVLAFGSVPAAREGARDARGARLLEDMLRDLAHGGRQLARRPTFTLVTVLTIALGIGAVTAIWSVVDGVLLRPMPFADPDALVVVWETDRNTGTTREPSSWPDFLDLEAGSASLAQTAALSAQQLTYQPANGNAERLAAIATTAGYFPMLGIEPMIGRGLTPEETRPGGGSVVLFGESFWRARFDADPSVVGRSIVLDDQAYEVIGIMPRAADFALDPLHARAAYHAPFEGGQDVDV